MSNPRPNGPEREFEPAEVIFAPFGVVLSIAIVAFVSSWLSDVFGSGVAIGIYGTYAVLNVLVGIVYLAYVILRRADDFAFVSDIFYVLVLAIGTALWNILVFSQLCRYLYVVFGGFSASSSDYWHWMWFGISLFANTLLFDAPQIFGFRLTEINATVLWSQTLVLLLNVIFQLIIVAFIVQTVSLFWKRADRRNFGQGDASEVDF